MKNFIKSHLYSLIITAISVLFSAAFTVGLALTRFLGAGIITIIALVLLAFSVLVFVLTKNTAKKVRTTIGTILAFIILLAQIISGYYIAVSVAALNQMSTPSAEYAELGVYVRIDDAATELADTKDYVFGILETLDRETTNIALEKLGETFLAAPKTQEFSGIEELLDALINSKAISAILINEAFLALLCDTEKGEEDISKIREICLIKIERETANIEEIVPENDGSVFTVYFSGIDTRGRISNRSRSDVNIIATVNTKTGQVLLVSTPRDYYVPLSISNGIPDKLTHAGVYGIDVSIDTLKMIYGINIDYYFKVNFDGFKNIIDALGGINVYSNYTFNAGKKFSFVKGSNFLNGEQALAFARARKQLPEGDQGRGKHQMEVINGVITKICSPAILANYTETLNGISGSFETSIPYEKIAKLVQNQIKNKTKWRVTSYAVSGTGASKKVYSLSLKAYVVVPDEQTINKAKDLMNQVRNGSVPNV